MSSRDLSSSGAAIDMRHGYVRNASRLSSMEATSPLQVALSLPIALYRAAMGHQEMCTGSPSVLYRGL